MTPPITKADLERLTREIAGGDKIEWLAERGIDPEAILWMSDDMLHAFSVMLKTEFDVQSAIAAVAGFAFQIGYEAAEQFRLEAAA